MYVCMYVAYASGWEEDGVIFTASFYVHGIVAPNESLAIPISISTSVLPFVIGSLVAGATREKTKDTGSGVKKRKAPRTKSLRTVF